MNRNWTKRGEITGQDITMFNQIIKNDFKAARILVTGEVYEQSLNSKSAHLLYAANDLLDSPLFIQTKEKTIQMARFEGEAVWKSVPPDKMCELVDLEIERFGLEIMPVNELDFYAALIAVFKAHYGEVTVPITDKTDLESFYQLTYLSCLWLFDKADYMTVPVSRHFALPAGENWMKNELQIDALSTKEMDELLELRKKYGNVQGITNHELNFILKLHKERSS